MNYRILRKSGRTRSSFDPFWHAVPVGNHRALCGSRPSVQWTDEEAEIVTCPRCRRILEAMTGAEEPRMI
jgi:hypothetical protein